MTREEHASNEARERYQRYLQTPHWHKTRLRVLARAGGRCEGEIWWEATTKDPGGYATRCKATDGLHVHHLHYNTLGHERLADLVCLCAACHAFEHLNYCELCDEAIFESRADMEDVLTWEGASLTRDSLPVLKAALEGNSTWPYCAYHDHIMNKGD